MACKVSGGSLDAWPRMVERLSKGSAPATEVGGRLL